MERERERLLFNVGVDMLEMDNELVKNTCFQSSSRYIKTRQQLHYVSILHCDSAAIYLFPTFCVVYRWMPKGQLVAHIHEHKDSINR